MAESTAEAHRGSAIGPFAHAGVWLRCALHCHTTQSDGMLSPAMLRRYYSMGHYDVLAITDHDQLTPQPDAHSDDDDLLLLPGTEISLRSPESGGPLHLLGLGINAMPRVPERATLLEAAAAVQAEGGLAFVAHPWWTGLRSDELGDLAGVTGIEVYNAGCEVEQGRGDSAQYWDALLSQGAPMLAIATDDHHYPGFDAFQGWTMVRAATRTPDAVLAALAAGHAYSSNGPDIHGIWIEADRIRVASSPAVAISLLGAPPRGVRVNAGPHGLKQPGDVPRGADGRRNGAYPGNLLTEATFPLLTGSPYLRVEVLDVHGRKAWSNPIWLPARD